MNIHERKKIKAPEKGPNRNTDDYKHDSVGSKSDQH